VASWARVSFGAVAAAAVVGCLGVPPPDQRAFAPLDSARDSGETVVRLYAARLPGIYAIAIHAWFVVKRADSEEFHRWEVWVDALDPYGYVRVDTFPPEADFGAGSAYVLGELGGTEAEPVAEFIETQSPLYSCRDTFDLIRGPNSSTYIQWVLDNAGWDVTLPPNAFGKDVPVNCP
jgi:hypothetical protein